MPAASQDPAAAAGVAQRLKQRGNCARRNARRAACWSTSPAAGACWCWSRCWTARTASASCGARSAGVSEKMLAQTLQALERDGFVLREAQPVIPPRVDYSLTPMGREVAGHVRALTDWIEESLPGICPPPVSSTPLGSGSPVLSPPPGARTGARWACLW